VRKDADIHCEDKGTSVIFPEDEPGSQQEYEHPEVMEKEPAIPDGGEDKVSQGLIDEVRQYCPDSTRDHPPAIVKDLADQKTKDKTGNQVEKEEHVVSFRVWCIP